MSFITWDLNPQSLQTLTPVMATYSESLHGTHTLFDLHQSLSFAINLSELLHGVPAEILANDDSTTHMILGLVSRSSTYSIDTPVFSLFGSISKNGFVRGVLSNLA